MQKKRHPQRPTGAFARPNRQLIRRLEVPIKAASISRYVSSETRKSAHLQFYTAVNLLIEVYTRYMEHEYCSDGDILTEGFECYRRIYSLIFWIHLGLLQESTPCGNKAYLSWIMFLHLQLRLLRGRCQPSGERYHSSRRRGGLLFVESAGSAIGPRSGLVPLPRPHAGLLEVYPDRIQSRRRRPTIPPGKA